MAFLERVPDGLLPPQRSISELMPGRVVDCDRPPKDESWEERAAREGAHVGGAGVRELQERNWLRSKLGMKPLICTGDGYVPEGEESTVRRASDSDFEGDVPQG